MSTTLTIDAMITQLQSRVPLALSNSFCGQELNKAWRWIEQRGAFTWNVRLATVTVASAGTTFTMPADIDIGKPASLYPVSLQIEIPYKPFDEFVRLGVFVTTIYPGIFTAWTYTASGSTTYLGQLTPAGAAPVGSTNYNLYYHHIVGPPIAVGSGAFFPTPDEFDDTIVDLAEAEIKRIYNLVRWDFVQKKAETAALLMVDKYRSPKRNLAGIQEQTMQDQNATLQRSQ